MSMQSTIHDKLARRFAPDHLEVLDESHRHNVPAGAESHFRVTLVSEEFTGTALLARHRAVNHALSDELAGSVHALALHTYTPAEWAARNEAPQSPPCLGGGGRS